MKSFLSAAIALGLCLFAQGAQAQWISAQRLTWNLGASESPSVEVDGSGHLHVVWNDDTPGNEEIYYKRSTDGGATWSPAKRLSWNTGSSELPAIAAGLSGNLHVVWQESTPGNGEIYHIKSTDGGDTWSAGQRITWNSGASIDPVMAAAADGLLHLGWADSTYYNMEIYYKQSSDSGVTWMEKKKLTGNSGRSWRPFVVAASAADLHLIWEDDTPEANVPEIYYTKSTDGGSSWASCRRLTYTSGSSLYPDLTVDPSGNLHLVWEDSTSASYEIFYKKSSDAGATWTSGKRLTWTPDMSRISDIVADPSGQLHVVWRDRTPGNYEVYYKKSTNGGTAWSTNRRLTWNSGESYNPVIAVDPTGSVHVIWFDDTPGNFELYYKKRT